MKQILLTQGKVALVDNENYEWLNQWKWHATKVGVGNYYAARKGPRVNGKQYTILMHRVVLGLVPGDGKIADHRNRDSLDNRNGNLRVANKAINCRNHNIYSHNTSGHNGVCWNKKNKKWSAQVWAGGRNVYLGLYSNIKDAIEARRQGELTYW